MPVGKAEVLVAVVELPASTASAQPSPSESKSNRLAIPSLSVSKSVQEKMAERLASVKIILVSEDALYELKASL